MLGSQFRLIAVVNDGELPLEKKMFNTSPVIRAHAIGTAMREKTKSTNKLFIKLPGTAEDLKRLQWYVVHASQSVHRPPGEMDLPTLITVTELALKLELEIPDVAHLIAFDLGQVLTLSIANGGDVKDYPWLELCHLAKKANDQRLFDSLSDSINWCFLNAARAKHSQQDALWALQMGNTVRKETGYQGLWTYGMYLCVIWDAFSEPNAPRLTPDTASAIDARQRTLATLMEGFAIPHLGAVHDFKKCVAGSDRQHCMDHWQAVWREAQQVASGEIYEEYKGTSFGGAERDVYQMLDLITTAVPEVAQAKEKHSTKAACDLMRFHASNGWKLEQCALVKAIINQLPRDT